MFNKKRLRNLGAYLVSGVLTLGTAAYANAQDSSVAQIKNQKPIPVNRIYAEKDLTVTGKSIFLVSDYTLLNLSENESYDLGKKFSSKEKVSYKIISPNELKGIIKNDSTDFVLKRRFEKFYKKAKNNKKSLSSLERAVKDGRIEANELEDVEEGMYAIYVYNSNQGVIRFVEVPGKLERKVEKEEQMQEVKKYEEKSGVSPEVYVAVPEKEETKKIEQRESTEGGRTEPGKSREKKKAKSTRAEKPRTRFGIEAAVGTNSEFVVGGFVDVPLTSWISLEGFGNVYTSYFARKDKGLPIFTESTPVVNVRDRQLIGPGTYKQRIDKITTDVTERAIAEMGAGLAVKMWNFELPLRVGAVLSRKEKRLDGKSTISFDRNGQPLGQPQEITNSKNEKPGLKWNLGLSAGVRYKLTKNLSVGVSGNRTGNVNSVRTNVRYNF
mgnify:CR=1 FL=1